MSNPARIRKQIESLKAKVARTEGEEATLGERSTKFKDELRQALDCEAGGEKAAMAELRRDLESSTAEVELLLERVEQSE